MEIAVPGDRAPGNDTSKRTRSVPDISILSVALATSQSLRALVGLRLAPLGLVAGQERLLIVLDEKGPLTVSALAGELNVRAPTVSKMTDRLQACGYIERRADETDGRRVGVILTPAGSDVCLRIHALYETIGAEFGNDLDEEKTRRMMDGIRLLQGAVDARLRRLR